MYCHSQSVFPARKPSALARLCAVISALAVFLCVYAAQAGGDEEHWIRLEAKYANKYVSEGFVGNEGDVYGLAVALDTPLFPLYAEISTIRDFAHFHEDEIVLAYSYEFVGNHILAGGLYSYEASQEEYVVSTPGTDGGAAVNRTAKRTVTEEGGELFLEFTSEEFYYTRMNLGYAHDLESRGGLLNIGLDIAYDINDIFAVGAGLNSEFDFGYADISELSGFYHIDYYLAFGAAFFAGAGVDVQVTYVVPYRDADDHGVTEEVIYQANVYFSF